MLPMLNFPRGADRLLAAQVRAQLWWWEARARLAERGRDERGDVYSSTIMVAVGVVIAITVGGILLYKFQTKANSIDTNTPTGPLPGS
ncbi:MAG: hypothetical protein KY447_12930 [Actinobacteria bacterium]|nr:hypothetical protein [Actinomycetota bacterium]